jgi:hypothetical protein
VKNWCRAQKYEKSIEVDLTRGASGTYDEGDCWPIKCPSCGHGFTETIGRIKSRLVSSCPGCSLDFAHSGEEFLLALSEARKGRHNPWWEILSVPLINQS